MNSLLGLGGGFTDFLKQINPVTIATGVIGGAIGAIGQGVASAIAPFMQLFGGDKGGSQVQNALQQYTQGDQASGRSLFDTTSQNFVGGEENANSPLAKALKSISDADETGMPPDFDRLAQVLNSMGGTGTGSVDGSSSVGKNILGMTGARDGSTNTSFRY